MRPRAPRLAVQVPVVLGDRLGVEDAVLVFQGVALGEVLGDELGVDPERSYTGGERGWIGDNPFIFLDCSRMRALGWRPELSIEQGIIRTLEFLRANPWVLENRG